MQSKDHLAVPVSEAPADDIVHDLQTLHHINPLLYEYAKPAADTILALRAEVEALREDAARYRWLRDTERLRLGPGVGRRSASERGVRYIIPSVNIGHAQHDVETLDAAIDAARRPPVGRQKRRCAPRSSTA